MTLWLPISIGYSVFFFFTFFSLEKVGNDEVQRTRSIIAEMVILLLLFIQKIDKIEAINHYIFLFLEKFSNLF